jgi:hypothetical protein
MEIQVIEQRALETQIKVEIDMQISTAKMYPRSVKQSMDNALSIATITTEVAESCTYSLPRAGKTIDGPTVRLAEIITSSFGNIRSGARVVMNDGQTITAQGICHDLETNNCVTVEVKRSILQWEYKNGQKTGNKVSMNDDMQVVVGNAACAIAFRNAVFKVIPAALVDSVYQQVKLVAKGTAATLLERRDKAIEWLKSEGIKEAQICKTLGVKKIEDIDLDKLSILTGFKSAVKNDGVSISDFFTEEDAKKQSATGEKFNQLKSGVELKTMTVEQAEMKFELTEDQITELKTIEDAKN